MDLTKHKENQIMCAEKAHYFKSIDFPIIAEAFRRAADSLKDMIEILDKLNELTIDSEEGNNG